jgi:hypothetical protein
MSPEEMEQRREQIRLPLEQLEGSGRPMTSTAQLKESLLMPRTNSRDVRPARSDRTRSNQRGVPANIDEQVLTMREANGSYSSIARRLSLRRATDAHRAFIRALGTRSSEDQRTLVANEQARLDTLEQRIRARDVADPEQLERRLQAVARLRSALP